jgi:D-alanyl-D-alanine carboxypeptidase
MGKYPGIDGMKTGYVCASGFNIAASATVRGRRMLAVVFGAGSTAKRSERVVRLLDAGFGGARPAGTLDDYRRKQAVTAIDVSQSVCGRGGQKAETVAAVDTVPSGLVTALGVTSDMPQDLAAALLAIGGSAPEPGTPYAIAPAKAAAVPRPAATLTKPADPAPAASVDELFAARADSLPPVPALSEVTVPPVASAPKPKVRPVAAAPAKRRF